MTIRPILTFGLDGFDVEWAEGLPLDYNQKDAAFYKTTSSSWIATLKKNGFEVDIYCEGELRAEVLADENRYETATTGPELIDYGVKNDDDLQHVEWVHNPWFDLYVDGEHLDDVTHEITDAVNAAKAYLDETIVNANQIENGVFDAVG